MLVVNFAFKYGKPGLLEKLIQLWTRSPYYHVGILLPNGAFYESAPGIGVRRVMNPDLDPAIWELVPRSFDEVPLHLGQLFLERELGCPYDWCALIWSQVLGIPRSHPEKWFCSELGAGYLGATGDPTRHAPEWYSPGRLFHDVEFLSH